MRGVRTMKNILIGALIPILLLILGSFYMQSLGVSGGWSEEHRVILNESPSPDEQFKVGVYHYNIGATGYSAVQVSVVAHDENYPISGNLLHGQKIESVTWLSNSSAEISILNEHGINSKLVFSHE